MTGATCASMRGNTPVSRARLRSNAERTAAFPRIRVRIFTVGDERVGMLGHQRREVGMQIEYAEQRQCFRAGNLR